MDEIVVLHCGVIIIIIIIIIIIYFLDLLFNNYTKLCYRFPLPLQLYVMTVNSNLTFYFHTRPQGM